MNFEIIKSPNFLKKTRKTGNIKFIIIHYTGMQSIRASIKRLLNPKSKVSCHYLISRDGRLIKMVDDNKIAWHAGKSKWKTYKNLNFFSIGIELSNKGHQFGYQSYPKKQLESLSKLVFFLKRKYKIKYILGHSDVAPMRKKDPGEKFPWFKISEENKKKLNTLKKDRKLFLVLRKKEIRKRFFSNLFKIGYRYFNVLKEGKTDKAVIKAFQRRFRQNNVNGVIDAECLKISEKLANFNKI
tara:strand:- start:114 stop:836 length:723 start_codon:yes stop_codon:yes gene_type:complete